MRLHRAGAGPAELERRRPRWWVVGRGVAVWAVCAAIAAWFVRKPAKDAPRPRAYRLTTRGLPLRMTEFLRDRLRGRWLKVRR